MKVKDFSLLQALNNIAHVLLLTTVSSMSVPYGPGARQGASWPRIMINNTSRIMNLVLFVVLYFACSFHHQGGPDIKLLPQPDPVL